MTKPVHSMEGQKRICQHCCSPVSSDWALALVVIFPSLFFLCLSPVWGYAVLVFLGRIVNRQPKGEGGIDTCDNSILPDNYRQSWFEQLLGTVNMNAYLFACPPSVLLYGIFVIVMAIPLLLLHICFRCFH